MSEQKYQRKFRERIEWQPLVISEIPIQCNLLHVNEVGFHDQLNELSESEWDGCKFTKTKHLLLGIFSGSLEILDVSL